MSYILHSTKSSTNTYLEAPKIAERANRAKFHSTWRKSDLQKKLARTGKKELVYAAPEDGLLGIGFDADEAMSVGKESWGQNVMGKMIASIRRGLPAEKEGDPFGVLDTPGSRMNMWGRKNGTSSGKKHGLYR